MTSPRSRERKKCCLARPYAGLRAAVGLDGMAAACGGGGRRHKSSSRRARQGSGRALAVRAQRRPVRCPGCCYHARIISCTHISTHIQHAQQQNRPEALACTSRCKGHPDRTFPVPWSSWARAMAVRALSCGDGGLAAAAAARAWSEDRCWITLSRAVRAMPFCTASTEFGGVIPRGFQASAAGAPKQVHQCTPDRQHGCRMESSYHCSHARGPSLPVASPYATTRALRARALATLVLAVHPGAGWRRSHPWTTPLPAGATASRRHGDVDAADRAGAPHMLHAVMHSSLTPIMSMHQAPPRSWLLERAPPALVRTR